MWLSKSLGAGFHETNGTFILKSVFRASLAAVIYFRVQCAAFNLMNYVELYSYSFNLNNSDNF